MKATFPKRLLAEPLGTFSLVVAGCGVMVVESQTGALRSLGLEVLLSAALMFVITAVATDTRAVGEFAALGAGAYRLLRAPREVRW